MNKQYIFLQTIILLVSARNINLNKTNTVRLVGEINEKLISKAIDDIYNIKSYELYIYIDTGGGSVYEGQKLINTIEYMKDKKNISCIVQQAMSMGFVILQSCPHRLSLKGGVLMQHQISTMINDQKTRLKNYMKFLDDLEDNILIEQANRIGITKSKFIELTYNDWYLTSYKALEYNVIDEIVVVGCDKSIMTPIFNATVDNIRGGIILKEYRECPLITNAINIKFEED
jgi:ATP-dependent protease ClpP protease subunit